jgi:cobalt-zinc-cadmium efflux system membrane fusion protein
MFPRCSLPRQRPAARFLARLFSTFVLALAYTFLPASAHEGHDHGPPAPQLPVTVKPRLAVHSDLYELVAIQQGAALSIFLDSYGTNEPIADATISILAGAETATAKARSDGTYGADIASLAKAGRHELIFTISHAAGDDLLAGEITIADVASTDNSAVASRRNWLEQFDLMSWLVAAIALATGLVLGRFARPRAALVLAVSAGAALASSDIASAHEGHGPSQVPSNESLSGDVPRRLPDGSVFLPKPSQRLLTVRSQIAVVADVPRAVRLVGRIIADPNRSGLVQSINGGRVSAPEGGLPTLGKPVSRGEVLATVIPALPLADQSTLAEKQRDLEGALNLARQRYARLNRPGNVSTPRAQIEDIEQEIANLEQRLATFNQARIRPEALEAPIGGIVSASRVVSGQVVQAQDVLFQIIDPTSLWVEALLFDPLDPSRIEEASATMPDGKVVALTFKGRGRAVQSQAALIQFAMVEPPPTALTGLPVTVHARGANRTTGILLPRDAVVRGPGGESIVWQHVDPERFVARPVRVEAFDGAQVIVTAGIGAKDRIVVHAAELLSQVR